ncbi:MAG: 4'-phosphopantetheinyl transferase superfamily protein [Clostridia bacterium]|nr:4'-phosphopantetheinyl transferase superfamily protein [Clostridia bacterium]
MISLYYSEPGSISIRELYERADTNSRKIFDESEKELVAYLSLFCRVLTDVGLADLGADPDQITVVKNEHGKEYVQDRGIYYNVSHTSGLVCSAVSDHDVGVDCETVREIDHEALSKRFFTQSEYERIKGAPDPLDEFFCIWTKKESYVKFTGEGFSRPLSSFDVSDIEDIQTTLRIGNTYITLTGDVTHVKFIKEGRRK